MLRSQVREEIFKILFRYPFTGKEGMEEQISFEIEELAGKSEANIEYIRNKVHAILEHLDPIDEKIASCCEGWSLNRIGKVEIAIMRIAVYEMLYEEDVPEKVSLNEAVELCKNYNEEASGFVNAVLGKVVKSLSE